MCLVLVLNILLLARRITFNQPALPRFGVENLALMQIRFRRGLPPGDGVLFYPGEVFSQSHQPVASARLERILSGLQVWLIKCLWCLSCSRCCWMLCGGFLTFIPFKYLTFCFHDHCCRILNIWSFMLQDMVEMKVSLFLRGMASILAQSGTRLSTCLLISCELRSSVLAEDEENYTLPFLCGLYDFVLLCLLYLAPNFCENRKKKKQTILTF